MNRIQKSMEGIRASTELKADTLRYLERRRDRSSHSWRRPAYVLAVLCLMLLIGAGGYSQYIAPISYISMDVNPSIELGINRYGRVVTAEAYNQDAGDILQRISLKNKPYVQAVRNLLEDESFSSYLSGNAALVFTIISDRPDAMQRELEVIMTGQSCEVLTYISDSDCMQEAHNHHMSFGKYRAYLELTEYDRSVTVEECHGMSMGELQERIEGCRQHQQTGYDGDYGNDADRDNTNQDGADQGHHGGHHGNHNR